MRLPRAFQLALAALVAFGAGMPRGYATFDPIGEDIDIFLANPAATAGPPNVLLMLDNTANWNQPFDNEKSALVTVVNSLIPKPGDQPAFNLGLMLFNEGGQPVNHGSYLRFGVRPMTEANANALAKMVDNFDILGDKGNNNTISEMINEAYLYWAGLTPYTGWGQAKRDYPGNAAFNPLAADLPGNALADARTPGTYVSPITNGCQKNFQIFVSNGPANENVSTLADMQNKLAALVGKNPPDTITLSNTFPDSNGQQRDWMDEYSRYMSKNDCNPSPSLPGVQSVITYVVEIDPKTKDDPGFLGGDSDMTTLMKSVAINGGGKYFAVSSADGGKAIVEALTQIFQEVQAKNTVFASTTLPVSVNVRGTNLNQVYIGVFRPDGNKSPRWFGNLKLYDLKVDSVTKNLFLADATGNPAADSTTGFTRIDALSFWTTTSNFWAFRSPFPSTDVGQASDSPDGDLVEKGGVAERLRIAYATDQTGRKLYTCTGSGCPCAGNSCSTPVALSGSPFNTANSDITAIALGTLVTTPVSTLTSIGNIATGTTTSAHNLNSGNTAVVAGASPAVYNGTFPNVTVIDSTHFSYTLPSSPSGNTATVSATAHGLVTNDLVDVSGASEAGYNVSGATVTKVDANAFDYTLTAPVTAASSGQTVVGRKLVQNLSGVGNTATVRLPGHGYSTTNQITITGATPTEFNVSNASITVTSTDTFTYTSGTFFSGSSSNAQGTTVTPHSFNSGDTVTVSCADVAAYNTTAVVTVIDGNKFQYTLSPPQSVDPSVSTALCPGATNIKVSKAGGGTAVNASSITITDPSTVTVNFSTAHPFQITDPITIGNVTPDLFNVGTTVASVPTPTSLTYTLAIPSVVGVTTPATGTIAATVGSTALGIAATYSHRTTGTNQAEVIVNTGSTSPPSAFAVGATVTIVGATQTQYNGTFRITSRTTTGSNRGFTYQTGVLSGVPAPTWNGTAPAITVAGGINRLIANTCGGGTSPCLQRAFVATGTIYAGKTITVNSITSQNNATGSITVANQNVGDATARASLIDWVRGQDNKENENAPTDTSFTDVRSSAHGDVLHSRPAVINYNRGGANGSNTGDDDVFAFYGGNDGVLHAVQGGFASNGGNEMWGFIAPEFFGKLKRLRDNTPLIGQPSGTSSPRDYFFDGPIGVYTLDVNRDGKLLASDGDKVYLFVGMRRGGRYLYALDVSDPANPKFMWKRGCPNLDNNTGCDAGFEEMGQTWSEPKVGFLKAFSNPVLIFGAGYDPAVEDFQPCLITAMDSTSVTARTGGTVTFTSAGSCTFSGTTSTTVNRSMGRGVFIVDATNGDLLFSFGPTGSGADKKVSGMDYAIVSDVAVLNRDGDRTRALPGIENIQPRLSGFIDRVYAVDTGGNIWRLDVDSANKNDWVATKFASLSGSSLADKRKFMFSPDVVFASDASGNFDAVLIGSGDREHPFDATVTNRFYMLKDRKTGLDATGQATIVDSTFDASTNPNGLFDASNNCLQDVNVCAKDSQALTDAQANLLAARGWKITFLPGEKDVGSATTLAGTTFFNTNQPTGSAAGVGCSSNLGVARQYAVSFQDATVPPPPPGVTWNKTAEGRSSEVGEGGYLPSPVPLIVEIGGQKYQAVISGTQLQSPGGLKLGARIRTYWYRKLE